MEKLNIAEILKDCPKGMELDCTLYDNVFFDGIDTNDDNFPISLYYKHNNIKNGFSVTKYGTYYNHQNAKCVIFPKGKTTWEGFKTPFKDGDILISGLEDNPFIFKRINGLGNAQCYCAISCFGQLILNNDNWTCIKGCRLATEEEKEKLFDAIKANGYKWNAETKTLEKLVKPKFKVDDKIKLKGGDEFGIITEVADCFYTIKCKNNTHCWPIKKQDDWELVPNKFDITTLKPFESRVLVRSLYSQVWSPAIYGFKHFSMYMVVGGQSYCQCIPYEGNEHLLGTTDNCDEYYKTW